MQVGTTVYYVDEPHRLGKTVGPVEDDGVEGYVPVEFIEDGEAVIVIASVGYLCAA